MAKPHGTHGKQPRNLAATYPGRVFMGRNAVQEALRAKPEAIERLFAAASDQRDGRFAELLRLAEEADVPVERVQSEELSALLGSDSHQSVALLLKRAPVIELKEFLAARGADESALLIAVDELHDPQNLGSILRAAECFGAAGVLWSRNRGSGLTPAVAKASVGAAILVPMIEVSNLADALKRLSESDFWVVAADAGGGAEEIGRFDWPKRSVLVLGAEGEGLKRLTLERAEFRVKIPMCGQIDSLNVAQAAAILMESYRRAMGAKAL